MTAARKIDVPTGARLLTRDQARVVCGGLDPYQVAPPYRFGRRLLWDRKLLDSKLDELGALKADEAANTNTDTNADDEIKRARDKLKGIATRNA